ncbi:hypothetical protein IQ06DRAFT_132142 [Phaeosphaeriaceae sp. SRC1lsM3a]|nr:hypothetical protein IQ06DRAFT_132142 [Stagonospora sp. SRC1lsM3a]
MASRGSGGPSRPSKATASSPTLFSGLSQDNLDGDLLDNEFSDGNFFSYSSSVDADWAAFLLSQTPLHVDRDLHEDFANTPTAAIQAPCPSQSLQEIATNSGTDFRKSSSSPQTSLHSSNRSEAHRSIASSSRVTIPKRTHSMAFPDPPALKCRCPCPIFKAEVEKNEPHTCNGGGGNNMSELRTHMTRGNKNRQPHLSFLKLCKTCNHDFIDENVFATGHGVNCHNPHPQRKGPAADTYYKAFAAMVLDDHSGKRVVSTEDYLDPEDDVAEQYRPDGPISDQGFGNILPSHTGDLHRSVSPISSSILTLTAASPQKEDTEKVRSSDTQIEQ